MTFFSQFHCSHEFFTVETLWLLFENFQFQRGIKKIGILKKEILTLCFENVFFFLNSQKDFFCFFLLQKKEIAEEKKS
jgi:hypothetical protein